MDYKEYHKQYNKKYYEEHKEYYKDYYKKYYKNNKEKILNTAKQWREEHKKDLVYFHVDKWGEIIYIGSSIERPLNERQSAHLTGNSHLKIDINEYVNKYNFSNIFYKDFTKYNLNKDDLHFIEQYFKDNYKEILKGKKVGFKEDNLSKSKEEIIKIAEEVEEFKRFNLEKYINT